MTYQIKNWNRDYETSETRKLKKISKVMVPNKMDGKGFRRLLKRPDGLEIFGCWVLLLELASKQSERGTFSDDDGPLSVPDIADSIGIQIDTLSKSLEVLISKDVNWIITDKSPDSSRHLPTSREKSVAIEEKIREEKRREEKNSGGNACARPAELAADVEPETPEPTPPINLRLIANSKRMARKPQRSRFAPADLLEVSQALQKYPGVALPGVPDEPVCSACLDAVTGDMGRFWGAIRALSRSGKQPGSSWMWFPRVLAARSG